MRQVKTLFLCAVLAIFNIDHVYGVVPVEQTPDEDWFDDDSDLSIEDVNEGELEFIAPITDKSILHSGAVLSITEKSLETGWVGLDQCYRNLDPVGKMEVVYRYKNINQLKITSFDNIGEAKIDGQTIQLEDVSSSATICVQAEVQILEKTGQGSFVLSNGPYYRRFLDGYYPYHVTVSISYPAEKLNYTRISPAPQPLFEVIQQPGRLLVDTWFEGVLLIDIKFSHMRKRGAYDY
jgi:hypothetical protein